MTTAALLPLPGDPFVFAYWLRNYESVWAGEVDELHVILNACPHDAAREYIAGELERVGVRFTVERGRVLHGELVRRLVDGCAADAVVLLENDAYVRQPGALVDRFDMLADICDVIGTPRGGMDPVLERAAHERWGECVSPEGSTGHGLWPCFLFATRAALEATDRDFGSRSWRVGETVPGLGYEVRERPLDTDTCTSVAFQLRGVGLRIRHDVQFKELWHKDPALSAGAPWFHAGGLSNADLITGDLGFVRPDIGGTNEGLDWAHRAWWWRRCVETAGDVLPDLQERYRDHLDRLVEHAGIRKDLDAWGEKLEPWISWDDRA